MAVTPYDDIPQGTFLGRVLGPATGLFFLVFMMMGVIANSPLLGGPKSPEARIPFWEASFKHLQNTIHQLSAIPEVCWSGSTVNDFQKQQCDQYWNNLFTAVAVAILPFAAAILFFLVSLDQFKGLYKKTKKRISTGKAIFSGTVTDPALAPTDLFSWFYCLRAVTVELKDKRQVKVYVSLDSPIPRPGQTLAVLEPFMIMGQRRYMAMLYMPHVAVIRGA